MYIVIKNVIYLVYMDEGEYWLRIRHLHYWGRLSASISVDKMLSLLMHGGKIELDEKKSDIKTLTFDSSNHLCSECKNIDTKLSNGLDCDYGIGDKQALHNMLGNVQEMTYALAVEKIRARMQDIRKSEEIAKTLNRVTSK